MTPAVASVSATREQRLQLAASVAGAAIVAFGVLFGGWSPLVVMALYWAENVVIGLLHVLRLLAAGARIGRPGAAAFIAVFFTLHYGLFTLGHGVFVAALFAVQEAVDSPLAFFPPLFAALLGDRATLLALAALALAAVFDTLRWLQSDASRDAKLDKLMAAPYGRIVTLHVALLGGGFLMQVLGLPSAAVLVLVALKLWFDLRPFGAARRAQPAAPA